MAEVAGIEINFIQTGLAIGAIGTAILAILTYKTYQTTHAFSFVAFWCVVAIVLLWLEITPIFLVLWAMLGGLAAMLGDVEAVIFIMATLGFTIYGALTGQEWGFGEYFGLAVAGVMSPILGSMVNQKVQPTKTEELMMNKRSAEIALRSETVVDSISDGVIVLDEKNDVLLINPAAIGLIGWGRDDAVGLNLQSVLILADGNNNLLEGEKNPVLAAIESKRSYSSKKYRLQTKFTGKFIPISLSVNLSTDDDGGSTIITFRDIERELGESKEKSDFISTASHEMRTPVASIEGYVALALNPQTATIDDRARKYLESAHGSAQHLGRLFMDLLDVTQLDDEGILAKPEPIEVSGFVQKVWESLAPLVREQELEYVFLPLEEEGKGSQKRISPVYYANVDLSLLRAVVSNLIENAIKYNKPNGRISVDVTGDGSNVIIAVQDTGIGIPPENVGHLFQKFYRVNNDDTREIGGTGLGLYICQQRVESMNGKIWVESEYHQGSTFFVSIPRLKGGEYERLMEEKKRREMDNKIVSGAEKPATEGAVAGAGFAVEEVVPVDVASGAMLNSNYYPTDVAMTEMEGFGGMGIEAARAVSGGGEGGVAEGGMIQGRIVSGEVASVGVGQVDGVQANQVAQVAPGTVGEVAGAPVDGTAVMPVVGIVDQVTSAPAGDVAGQVAGVPMDGTTAGVENLGDFA